jgi:hypothetical protein
MGNSREGEHARLIDRCAISFAVDLSTNSRFQHRPNVSPLVTGGAATRTDISKSMVDPHREPRRERSFAPQSRPAPDPFPRNREKGVRR